MKKRFAIQHAPSSKFIYEDEGGIWLVDEEDGLFSFGDKKRAEGALEYLIEAYCFEDNGIMLTEDGDFPKEEFVIIEI
jgi:hypothetical protein